MNTRTQSQSQSKSSDNNAQSPEQAQPEKGVTNSTPRKLNELFYLSKARKSKGGNEYRNVARMVRKGNDDLDFKWDNELVAFPTKSGGFMICERVETEE